MAKKFSEATTKTVAEFADPATAYLMGVDMDASPDAFRMSRAEVRKLIVAGSDTQIQFNNSGSFGGSSGLTWSGTGVAIASGTLTGSSSPALSITQTWNNAATTFQGALINVTDTASNAASKSLDIQLGNVSQASFSKNGNLTISESNSAKITLGRVTPGDSYPGLWMGSAAPSLTNYTMLLDTVGNAALVNHPSLLQYRINGTAALTINSSAVIIPSDRTIGFTSTAASSSSVVAAVDVSLNRDAADTLALRRGANPQDFRVFNAWSSATNNEYLDIGFASNVAEIGTVKGSGGGTARALRLKTDNTERVNISATGVITFAANQIGINTSQTPASATAAGTTGTICWDANFIYVATGTNQWKRAALSTW